MSASPAFADAAIAARLFIAIAFLDKATAQLARVLLLPPPSARFDVYWCLAATPPAAFRWYVLHRYMRYADDVCLRRCFAHDAMLLDTLMIDSLRVCRHYALYFHCWCYSRYCFPYDADAMLLFLLTFYAMLCLSAKMLLHFVSMLYCCLLKHMPRYTLWRLCHAICSIFMFIRAIDAMLRLILWALLMPVLSPMICPPTAHVVSRYCAFDMPYADISLLPAVAVLPWFRLRLLAHYCRCWYHYAHACLFCHSLLMPCSSSITLITSLPYACYFSPYATACSIAFCCLVDFCRRWCRALLLAIFHVYICFWLLICCLFFADFYAPLIISLFRLLILLDYSLRVLLSPRCVVVLQRDSVLIYYVYMFYFEAYRAIFCSCFSLFAMFAMLMFRLCFMFWVDIATCYAHCCVVYWFCAGVVTRPCAAACSDAHGVSSHACCCLSRPDKSSACHVDIIMPLSFIICAKMSCYYTPIRAYCRCCCLILSPLFAVIMAFDARWHALPYPCFRAHDWAPGGALILLRYLLLAIPAIVDTPVSAFERLMPTFAIYDACVMMQKRARRVCRWCLRLMPCCYVWYYYFIFAICAAAMQRKRVRKRLIIFDAQRDHARWLFCAVLDAFARLPRRCRHWRRAPAMMPLMLPDMIFDAVYFCYAYTFARARVSCYSIRARTRATMPLFRLLYVYRHFDVLLPAEWCRRRRQFSLLHAAAVITFFAARCYATWFFWFRLSSFFRDYYFAFSAFFFSLSAISLALLAMLFCHSFYCRHMILHTRITRHYVTPRSHYFDAFQRYATPLSHTTCCFDLRCWFSPYVILLAAYCYVAFLLLTDTIDVVYSFFDIYWCWRLLLIVAFIFYVWLPAPWYFVACRVIILPAMRCLYAMSMLWFYPTIFYVIYDGYCLSRLFTLRAPCLCSLLLSITRSSLFRYRFHFSRHYLICRRANDVVLFVWCCRYERCWVPDAALLLLIMLCFVLSSIVACLIRCCCWLCFDDAWFYFTICWCLIIAPSLLFHLWCCFDAVVYI